MNAKPMDSPPGCFVSGGLAAVLRLSRFAGIAPLRFVKKSTGWRVSMSQGWNIYGYVIVSIYNLIITAVVVTELKTSSENSVQLQTVKHRVVYLVKASLMMIAAGMSVYGAPWQMRSMIACLNQVQKINSALNCHHSPLEKKKIGLFIFWMTAIVTTYLLDKVLWTYWVILLNVNIWIAVMYSFNIVCYLILVLRQMLFVMITLHVKNSFKTVNDRLRSLLSDAIINLRGWSNHEAIHHLALKYASLCNVVRDVNQRHGPIILMILCSHLLHLICTSYIVVRLLLADDISNDQTKGCLNIIMLMVQLSWCVLHTFNLVMILEPCHLTHMEMETTRALVSHLMHYTHSIDDRLAVELELFYRHLVLNECSYKPMNVVTMNRSLVVTILGSITTYLVIIIQL